MPRPPIDPSLRDRWYHRRLLAKFTVSDDCWIWTGSQSGRIKTGEGYGSIKRNGRSMLAHRVMYELLVGPIPEGLQLDHLCRNHICVRPDHLEPVTGPENTRRGNSGKWQRERTHCPSGHPYDEENTYVHPVNGERACRTCKRLWQRAYVERMRA